MLKKSNIITSAAIVVWYLIGAANGWKGWALSPTTIGSGSGYSTGSSPGGHGSIYSGGWGGGK